MSARTSVILVQDGYLPPSATFTSDAISVMSFPLVSIHAWISAGTPSGSLTIQVSDEENAFSDGYCRYNSTVPIHGLSDVVTHWVNLESVKTFPATNSFTALTLTSGSPSQVMFDLDVAGFKWLRLLYTASSGFGTLQATLTGKRNKATGQ